MSILPAANYISDPSRTEGESKVFFEDIRDVIAENPGNAAETVLTISSGFVVPTTGIHSIDTEGGGGTDDLTNITTTNMPDGRLLYIRAANAARDVVVKHNAGGDGEIFLADGADLTLSDTETFLLLKRTGDDWDEIFRTSAGGLGAPNLDTGWFAPVSGNTYNWSTWAPHTLSGTFADWILLMQAQDGSGNIHIQFLGFNTTTSSSAGFYVDQVNATSGRFFRVGGATWTNLRLKIYNG